MERKECIERLKSMNFCFQTGSDSGNALAYSISVLERVDSEKINKVIMTSLGEIATTKDLAHAIVGYLEGSTVK